MKFDLIEVTEAIAGAASVAGTSYDLGAKGCDSFSASCVATVDTPSAKTFDSGESEVSTFTFDTKANTGAADYAVVYDTAGLAWAVYADKTGSGPVPTGPIWVAIPAGRKTKADITASTTAAQVAAVFETSFNSLTAFPLVADDSAGSGALAVTCTIRGPTTNASVHNAGDSGAGSIAVVITNEGVASEVDVDANSVTIPTHGYTLGLKGQLTTTGTLPTGLSLATDYFIIVVDANTVKFANSLVNAVAGTEVNITTQGTDGAVNTFTATALAGANIKLQKSNNNVVWFDEGSATNITVTANFALEKDRPTMRYMRVYLTLTAGHISVAAAVLGKGDKQ